MGYKIGRSTVRWLRREGIRRATSKLTTCSMRKANSFPATVCWMRCRSRANCRDASRSPGVVSPWSRRRRRCYVVLTQIELFASESGSVSAAVAISRVTRRSSGL